MGYLYEDLTGRIIGCFYTVYDELRGGFLESVYEKALLAELQSLGLKVENQKKLDVYYRNKLVGEFRADLVVEDRIIIEIKAIADRTSAKSFSCNFNNDGTCKPAFVAISDSISNSFE